MSAGCSTPSRSGCADLVVSDAPSDSMEPLIDNLWLYGSVMSSGAGRKSNSVNLPEGLPVSTGGRALPPPTLSGSNFRILDREKAASRSKAKEKLRDMDATSRKTFLAALKTTGKSFHEDSHRGLQFLFDTFDENHDGQLSSEELIHWMSKLGLHITKDGMIQLLRSADANKDGSLDFPEFVTLSKSLEQDDAGEKEGEGRSDLEDAFRLFDKDQDGLISPADLKATLLSMGLWKDDQLMSCERMIRSVDTDGDGEVSFSEFRHMMET